MLPNKLDCSDEDVGNVISFEHVNLAVPDQGTATLFYVAGLGLTRDPYLSVNLDNMWVNAGEQQFHLPTRGTQIIPGHIGVVIPDLDSLKKSLESVEKRLSGTAFKWSALRDRVEVTCPWGNQFRCFGPDPLFGDRILGIPYVEFLVNKGSAAGIARFYQVVLDAPAGVESGVGIQIARVEMGRNQWLVFRETEESVRAYDGHHIAIYVAKFSAPYHQLKALGLISEDVRNHQFRFRDVVDPDSGEVLLMLEHEVRSLHHPMYRRPLINRDPSQTQRGYRRGRDGLIPFDA